MPTVGARIIGKTPVPGRSAGAMSVSVKVRDPELNGIYVIYIALKEMDSAGPFVEFTYLGGDYWEVGLYGLSGTFLFSKTMLSSPTFGGYTLQACVDGPFFKGTLPSSDEYPWVDDLAGNVDGRYYGLGINGVGTATVATANDYYKFDEFYVTELRIEKGGTTGHNIDPDLSCFECFCRCSQNNVSGALIGTFTGTTGRATCLEGEDFPLNWDWEAGSARWYGEYTYIRTGTVGPWEHDFLWQLICGQYDGQNPLAHFTMTMLPPQVCASVAHPPKTPHSSSLCVPLQLIFGPYYINSSDMTCGLCSDPLSGDGTFWITVTEAPV